MLPAGFRLLPTLQMVLVLAVGAARLSLTVNPDNIPVIISNALPTLTLLVALLVKTRMALLTNAVTTAAADPADPAAQIQFAAIMFVNRSAILRRA